MTEFFLYNAPQSTCSQRVRFSLNAKNLPFNEKLLDLFSGDQLKEDYLKINPNAVVPALIHNQKIILDSAVIIEYLDEVKPVEGLTFTPIDPSEKAKMRWMMRYVDEVPTPAIRVPSYNLAFLPHFQKMTEEEFLAVAESKPLRKEFLLSMGRTGFPKKEMDSALDRLQRAIVRMSEWIDQHEGTWIMGDQLSLVDIAIMPVIVRLDDINLNSMWSKYPNISRWFELIKDHPAFAKTYYFGSLLTEKYPHLSDIKKK